MLVFTSLFIVTMSQSIVIILLLNMQLDFVPILNWYFSDGNTRDFTQKFYVDLGTIFLTRMFT